MKYVFHIFILLEMICVNLYTTHMCSKKRTSVPVIILVNAAYTILVVGLSIFLLKDTPNYGTGGGLPIFLGMTYLFPLSIVYKQSIKYTISIICSAWVYTMIVFSLSVQTARLFPPVYLDSCAFVIQTVLYGLTLFPFLKFIKERFLYIIKNADGKNSNTLLQLGLLWFVFVVLFNYSLTVETPHIVKTVVLLLLAANALMTYNLFYSFSRANQSTLELERASRLDALTGLKNRKAFFEDIQEQIDNRTSFTIIFMDLDNFKSINDEYGHLTGDQYLKHFSDRFSTHFSYVGTVYRISGDEFVFLYETKTHGRLIYEKIEKFDAGICCGNVSFKGLSIGRADYPSDAATLHDLISVADERMYQAKGISENK